MKKIKVWAIGHKPSKTFIDQTNKLGDMLKADDSQTE